MFKVSAQHARRDDLEASLSKLVSAFLAVAEDLVAEERGVGERKSCMPTAAVPAVDVASRSDTRGTRAIDRERRLIQSNGSTVTEPVPGTLAARPALPLVARDKGPRQGVRIREERGAEKG